METLKKILKTIGSFLLTVVLTVIAVFIIIAKMNNTTDEKDKAEKNKEDKKNELENAGLDLTSWNIWMMTKGGKQ